MRSSARGNSRVTSWHRTRAFVEPFHSGGVPIWVVNFMGEVVGGVEGFCFTSAMLFSGTLRSRLGLLLNRLEVRF